MNESLKKLLETIGSSGLTDAQLLELEKSLREVGRQSDGQWNLEVDNQKGGTARTCPHCGCTHSIKFGQDARGQQRYRCIVRDENGCGRTYTPLTGTALSGIKNRDQWEVFLAAMAKGYRSINELLASGEVQASRTTIWRWRHRLLRALQASELTESESLVEADKTYVRQSFKGSRGWKRGNPPAPRAPRRRGVYKKRSSEE